MQRHYRLQSLAGGFPLSIRVLLKYYLLLEIDPPRASGMYLKIKLCPPRLLPAQSPAKHSQDIAKRLHNVPALHRSSHEGGLLFAEFCGTLTLRTTLLRCLGGLAGGVQTLKAKAPYRRGPGFESKPPLPALSLSLSLSLFLSWLSCQSALSCLVK